MRGLERLFNGSTICVARNHLCSSMVRSGHILLESDLWREIFQGGEFCIAHETWHDFPFL